MEGDVTYRLSTCLILPGKFLFGHRRSVRKGDEASPMRPRHLGIKLNKVVGRQVDQLIQALATYSASSGLTWDQAVDQRPDDVQAILAASWH